MKKRYTRKQIVEAINYWKKQIRLGNYKKLNESNDDIEAVISQLPKDEYDFLFGDDSALATGYSSPFLKMFQRLGYQAIETVQGENIAVIFKKGEKNKLLYLMANECKKDKNLSYAIKYGMIDILNSKNSDPQATEEKFAGYDEIIAMNNDPTLEVMYISIYDPNYDEAPYAVSNDSVETLKICQLAGIKPVSQEQIDAFTKIAIEKYYQ